MKKYIMECIGTMFLVLAISMTGSPVAIGAMLAVLMYLGAHISGGHYNPAVSLGMWLRGKMKLADALNYMGFQVLGAVVAAGIYWILAGQRYFISPAMGVPFLKVFIVELVFTFFLVFVILTIATAKKVKVNHSYGLVIGLALMTIAFLGGAYNPAVCLGPALLDFAFGGPAMRYVPVYLMGTLAGGAFAALFYRYLYSQEF
jgi:aquaporin Z